MYVDLPNPLGIIMDTHLQEYEIHNITVGPENNPYIMIRLKQLRNGKPKNRKDISEKSSKNEDVKYKLKPVSQKKAEYNAARAANWKNSEKTVTTQTENAKLYRQPLPVFPMRQQIDQSDFSVTRPLGNTNQIDGCQDISTTDNTFNSDDILSVDGKTQVSASILNADKSTSPLSVLTKESFTTPIRPQLITRTTSPHRLFTKNAITSPPARRKLKTVPHRLLPLQRSHEPRRP
jgi:hypothetical protein